MTKTNAKTAVAAKTAKNKGPRASDTIKTVSPIKSGMEGLAVTADGQPTLLIPTAKMTPAIIAEAVVGGSYSKVARLWAEANQAKLANGVDARSNPHSAKAVADNRAAKAKTSTKADKAAETAKAKAAKATAKAEKAAPKADDNRKITILDKKFTYGREGTSRRSAWDACAKAKTVADYASAGGKLKYLPRWVAAGAIKLA